MSQAVKLGIFMTACLVVLGYLILRVEDWRFWGSSGTRIDALFESVVGLDDRAAVRLAGVRVGRVDGIRLEGRKARVTLLLDQPLGLTEGSLAAIANQGLLGDKFVELVPGPEGAPPLAPGAVLPGRTPVSFDQAMEKIDEIGSSVQSFFGGMTGEAGPSGPLGELIASVRATSDELRALIAENRASLGGTVRNFERFSSTLADELPKLTERIERVLGQVDQVVTENRGNLKDSMANLKEVSERVQHSVDNLNLITDKIARGEGTIGKLVNSDEAHRELIGALGSVEKGVATLTDTLGRVRELKVGVGLEGAYLSAIDDSRSAFRLDIAPHGDDSPRYYRFELVSDPRGRVSENSVTETVTRPDGSTEVTVTDTLKREERRNNWSALFGFPFAARRGSLWAGIIENSAGVQIDYGFRRQLFQISFEAFDFARERDLDPHLRLTGQWNATPHLYLRIGYDDPLVDEYRSPFLGAGVRWGDDDLKYLLGSVPKL